MPKVSADRNNTRRSCGDPNRCLGADLDGGDPYGSSPVFGYPPPPAYGYVTTPPLVQTAPPLVQSDVYLAPGQTYVAPGTAYADQPIIIEGRRDHRDCWWDWGQRKCELKPWW